MSVKLTPYEKCLYEMQARQETSYDFLQRVFKEQKGYEMAKHVLIHHRNEFEGRKVVPLYVTQYFDELDKEPTRLPSPEFRSIIRV